MFRIVGHWVAGAALLSALHFCGEAANAEEMHLLPLQREGQASVTIDNLSRTAFIVDLGKSGDGNQVMINGKPLIDYLAIEKKVENLVVACSHPHDDHMGGIEALFKGASSSFYFEGDLSKPKFKSITVIDDGVSNSLAKLYETFAKSVSGKAGIKFTQIKVTDKTGRPQNAYAHLANLQQELTIENVVYDRRANVGKHGRSIITLTRIKDGPVIADFDDADTEAVRSAVEKLKASGTTKIDAFVVPHHGSRYQDISPILELTPAKAIFTVNPNNRFGHPTSPILARLMTELGPENVLFTGSQAGVVIDKGGVRSSLYTAAHRDSYALFVEHARMRVEKQAPSKARTDELALFDDIWTMMFKGPPPPDLFDPGLGPDSPAPGPNRPAGGGGRAMLDARLASQGSILTPDFDADYPSSNGLAPHDLKKNRLFTPDISRLDGNVIYVSVASEEAARAPVELGTVPANTQVRYLSPTGLDSAIVPTSWSLPVTATTKGNTATGKGNALPHGGMVYLTGDKVIFVDNGMSLFGATVGVCGKRLCLHTPTISFELPFSDVELFKEVWHKVNSGVGAFYLSINPRKEYLKDPLRFKDIPSGKMRFGSGLPVAGDGAMNEVVTEGGIAKSRIGKILWDADVAFKSAALGVDVKTGVRTATYASVGADDSQAGDVQADLDVSADNRWCRLYWTSGAPKLVLNSVGKRVDFSGDAVVAKAEPMRLVAGELKPYEQGTWCQREKRLATRLQRQANSPTVGAADLQRLRELAQMQSFAMWAKARNVVGTPALQWEQSENGSIIVPTWTSGIRSMPVFQVQLQHSMRGGSRSHTVHMYFNDGKTYKECFERPWSNVDDEWRRLGLRKEGDVWQITSIAEQEMLANWLTAFAGKVARCGNGVQLPTLNDNVGDDNDGFGGKSTIGPVEHAMSSQIHGGVLLGMSEERSFADAFEPNAALRSLDGSLFLRRQAGELSFWNSSPSSNSIHTPAQRIVFSDAKIMDIRADEGMVRIAVSTNSGSIVRKETRVRTAEPPGPGLEVLEAYQASTGRSVLQKAVRDCPNRNTQETSLLGCFQWADMPAKAALVATFKDDAPPEVADMRLMGDGVWVVELDMRHVKDAIDAQWNSGNRNDVNHALRVSRLYAQWGYHVEASSALIEASRGVSRESQDTLLLAQVMRKDGRIDPREWRRMILIVREVADIMHGLEANTVSAEAAARRIFKVSEDLDRPTMPVSNRVMEFVAKAADMAAMHIKSESARQRLTAISRSWQLKAQTQAALDAGIINDE